MKLQLEISVCESKLFIGIKIQRDRTDCSITLSQEHDVKDMLKRFGMENSRGKSTPADPYSRHTKAGCSGDPVSKPFDEEVYREAVGTHMCISVCTRPDIAYAIGRVAQFCSAPKKAHWAAVQRVMANLKETVKFGIKYGPSGTKKLMVYSDSDFGGDSDT